MAKKTIGLTIFLIKPGISRSDCLRVTKATSTSEFEFPDGTKASLHTFSTPPHAPKWYNFFSDVVQNLPSIVSSSASAVLFVSKDDRLFAVTFGYGRSLLVPGSWEEDFGLKVTLNSVDRTKIKTVDRMTLDAIGQHSRIQASRDAVASICRWSGYANLRLRQALSPTSRQRVLLNVPLEFPFSTSSGIRLSATLL